MNNQETSKFFLMRTIITIIIIFLYIQVIIQAFQRANENGFLAVGKIKKHKYASIHTTVYKSIIMQRSVYVCIDGYYILILCTLFLLYIQEVHLSVIRI
jgi:hypothetical protein